MVAGARAVDGSGWLRAVPVPGGGRCNGTKAVCRAVIPFLNHPRTLPALLAARSYCRHVAIAFTNDSEMESKSAEIGLALLHERRKRLPRRRLAQHAAKAGGLLRHGREHLRALAAFHQALGLDQRRQRLA